MRHGPNKVINCLACGNPWGVIRPTGLDVAADLLLAAISKITLVDDVEPVRVEPVRWTDVVYLTDSQEEFIDRLLGNCPIEAGAYWSVGDCVAAGLPSWLIKPRIPAVRWDCCNILWRTT